MTDFLEGPTDEPGRSFDSLAGTIVKDRKNYNNDDSTNDLLRRIVGDVLAEIDKQVPAGAKAEFRERTENFVQLLADRVFMDVSPILRENAAFVAREAEINSRFRDGRSVHLELGTFNVWPDERVKTFIDLEGIGDMIRLDMNTDFELDVAASVTALPFADESIDRISSNSLFEHVAYPHDIIREAFRVLRPGGVLVTTVPFHFVEHGCPADYLRYTGQFFTEVCGGAGFEEVVLDTYSYSGVYYTTHQLLKGALAMGIEQHPLGPAAELAHQVSMALLTAFQGLDLYFHAHGVSHWHTTRAIAIKPGQFTSRPAKPDRSLPFVERFLGQLICPVSGLPLRKSGDALYSLDFSHRYDLPSGKPNLFVLHGFNSSFTTRRRSEDCRKAYSNNPWHRLRSFARSLRV